MRRGRDMSDRWEIGIIRLAFLRRRPAAVGAHTAYLRIPCHMDGSINRKGRKSWLLEGERKRKVRLGRIRWGRRFGCRIRLLRSISRWLRATLRDGSIDRATPLHFTFHKHDTEYVFERSAHDRLWIMSTHIITIKRATDSSTLYMRSTDVGMDAI